MNDIQLYSDRDGGKGETARDELLPDTLRGLVDLFDAWLGRGMFAEAYPETCPDSTSAVCGTDRVAFGNALRAVVPGKGWPWPAGALPTQDCVFDVVEFVWQRASVAALRSSHSFFKHDHLASFDPVAARATIRTEVNLYLSRGGASFRLSKRGRIERGVVPEVEVVRSHAAASTPDEGFNQKVNAAMDRYLGHTRDERMRAVEEIWDAFEGGKTLLSGANKKARAQAFVSSQPLDIQDVLVAEMATLTSLGNRFRVRHHEIDIPLVPDEYLDFFFVRAATVVRLMQKAQEQAGDSS